MIMQFATLRITLYSTLNLSTAVAFIDVVS